MGAQLCPNCGSARQAMEVHDLVICLRNLRRQLATVLQERDRYKAECAYLGDLCMRYRLASEQAQPAWPDAKELTCECA